MKWLCAVLIFIISASAVSAQEFNAGIVQGLWYDRDVLFVGDTTRIYVAIRNNTGADLSGRVEFYDNGELIERTNVSALDNRIIETWADWAPSFGEHTITASLSRIELSKVGSTTKTAEVVSALAEDTVFVDRDTDSDGIGNTDDQDDDNDGISDNKEKADGTDPLDPNDPAPPETTATESDNEDPPEATQETNVNVDQNGSEPDGLEQYLTESRADNILSTFTESINETKRRIDAYRSARSTDGEVLTPTEDELADSPSESASSSSTTSETASNLDTVTNENGFGSVSRSQDTPKEQGASVGWFQKITDIFVTIIDRIYTFILLIFSLYLGHPVLVQLSLLFLILFILLKVAKRVGGRPNQ